MEGGALSSSVQGVEVTTPNKGKRQATSTPPHSSIRKSRSRSTPPVRLHVSSAWVEEGDETLNVSAWTQSLRKKTSTWRSTPSVPVTMGGITAGDDTIPTGLLSPSAGHGLDPDGVHVAADTADVLRSAGKPAFSTGINRAPPPEVQRRFAELESLRSRKPIFRRMRALMMENERLKGQVRQQAAELETAQWELAAGKNDLLTLRAEVTAVRAATTNMAKRVMESEAALGDLTGPAGRSPAHTVGEAASETATPGGEAWTRTAVQRIFDRFDGNQDGVLDVREMNKLQKAVGNAATYTGAQYRAMCKAVGAEWVPTLLRSSGGKVTHGITAAGLFKLYNNMGLDALTHDMEALGVPPESASEQLRLLRRAVSHLASLETRVQGANARQAEMAAELRQSEAKRAALSKQVKAEQSRVEELETMADILRTRAVAAESEMKAARATEATTTADMASIKAQLAAAQDGLKQMRALLQARVDEKADLQRQLWALELNRSRFDTTLRRSQEEVWRASESRREASKRTRQLYMRLHTPKPGLGVESGVQTQSPTAP